jgi:hypothetical protein
MTDWRQKIADLKLAWRQFWSARHPLGRMQAGRAREEKSFSSLVNPAAAFIAKW